MTVSEWAEQYRYLSPEASAEPGKWYNARAPHLVAPMDALSAFDPCERVVLKFSSQTGKTEVTLNFIGYIMFIDPGPILVIQPNVSPMGEAYSKDRITPMLRDTPVLSNLVGDRRGRDSNNTLSHKAFRGGHLTITGANLASAAGLASRPIRYLIGDEVARFEVTKEGDPLRLARKRSITFFNRKELLTSSPTVEEENIDAEYNECEQKHERHLVCPDCGDSQMPAMRHFLWSDREEPVYVCEHCGTEHSFTLEEKLKAKGIWKCTRNEGVKSKGYWMNQFTSPFASWHHTIQEFLSAKDDPTRLQVFVNTALAEVWTEPGETVDETGLLSRREKYDSNRLPNGILLITCGIDTQNDSLHYELVGWGLHEESWCIDRGVFYGDPQYPEVWEQLDQFLNTKYKAEDERILNIAATCIDSGGHRTQQVYDFVKHKQQRRIYAIKGIGGEDKPLVYSPANKRTGKTKLPVKLFSLGVDSIKSIVYTRLRQPVGAPGYCHFSTRQDEEYFAQLTAEKRVRKMRRGFAYYEWQKMRQRNETLDCRVYATAALYIIKPQWEVLAAGATLEVVNTQQEKQQKQPTVNNDWINSGSGFNDSGGWL